MVADEAIASNARKTTRSSQSPLIGFNCLWPVMTAVQQAVCAFSSLDAQGNACYFAQSVRRKPA